jgi:hypothetical protein
LDSYRFLSASLSAVCETIPQENFKMLQKYMKTENDYERLKQLAQKQHLPYTWFDSFSKYEETLFPEATHFYNDLTGENISNEDYSHAKNMYETIGCKNMGEYTQFYLKCDVNYVPEIQRREGKGFLGILGI